MKVILAWFILMAAIICGKSCEAQAYTYDPCPYSDDIVVATIIMEAGGEYKHGALEAVYEVLMRYVAVRYSSERIHSVACSDWLRCR